MRVFISGSRKIKKLPDEAIEMLDKLMDDRDDVLVGDCPEGVDKLVQDYLYSKQYGRVTVYTSGTIPRYYCPSDMWSQYPMHEYDYYHGEDEYHKIKDRRMTIDCDYGICVWNGKSRATKANIKRLAKRGKKCIIFGVRTDV